MDWVSNHVNPVITPVFWALIRTPADQRNMAQIAADAEKIGPQFQVLEQGLDGKDYVAGKTFTMGDIVVGVNVYRWYALDVKRPPLPRVEAYYKRLQQRPAFQKHIMKPLT
jgi:glutathione S-transferase